MATSRTGDLINPAERLAREEYERSEKRRQELAQQRSELNPPEVRIRTWERMHQLRMPSDPAHPILDVIAISTRLTLEEVREEQRMRAARGASQT
jgi:5'-deoxynucleotidase YfbR-like HD superfamily hydrolase